MKNILPVNYKEFCANLEKSKKRSTAKKIFYYILCNIVVLFFAGIFIMFISAARRSNKRRFPSETHRKVIKEGILWDSVEWHER